MCNVADKIKISIGENRPIKFEYGIDKCRIDVYIAPKLMDEDEEEEEE